MSTSLFVESCEVIAETLPRSVALTPTKSLTIPAIDNLELPQRSSESLRPIQCRTLDISKGFTDVEMVAIRVTDLDITDVDRIGTFGDSHCQMDYRMYGCPTIKYHTMSFFVELWESIFTPGISPALLKATHASFILLLLSLLSLVYYTRSIHFINLFVIALFLYGAVMWFVKELQYAKLKDNEELAEKAKQENEEKEEEPNVVKVDEKKPSQARKRKA